MLLINIIFKHLMCNKTREWSDADTGTNLIGIRLSPAQRRRWRCNVLQRIKLMIDQTTGLINW